MLRMIFKKEYPQKKYLIQLKKKIQANCISLKKRLANFPVKTLKKSLSFDFGESTKVLVQENEIEIKDAIHESLKKYDDLTKRSRPSYYNDILHEFISDAKNKKDNELIEVYNKYSTKIDDIDGENKEMLYYCLAVIKTVSKTIKERGK